MRRSHIQTSDSEICASGNFREAQAASIAGAKSQDQVRYRSQVASSALIEFGRQADVTVLVDPNARDIQAPGPLSLQS
jgi:hypothetical protein